MKKILIGFLILIISILFVSCSNNQSSKETETSNEKSTTYASFNFYPTESSTNEAVNYPTDWNIEHVYMYVYGMKKELKISQSLVDDLERSKTVETPTVDSLSLAKLGKITIVEKSSTEEKEFGILYIDNKGLYYLKCNENSYDALLSIKMS